MELFIIIALITANCAHYLLYGLETRSSNKPISDQ